MEGCIYKPRGTKDCWKLPEARREAGNPSGASKSNQNCLHLDFRLLVSRTVKESISVLLGQLVCGSQYVHTVAALRN